MVTVKSLPGLSRPAVLPDEETERDVHSQDRLFRKWSEIQDVRVHRRNNLPIRDQQTGVEYAVLENIYADVVANRCLSDRRAYIANRVRRLYDQRGAAFW